MASVDDVPRWNLPGTVVDRQTGDIYNFEDDFSTMQINHVSQRSVREYHGVPRSAPSRLFQNEAVGIGVNPITGQRMYVPSILNDDNDEKKEEIQEEEEEEKKEYAIDIDMERRPPTENELRFQSQQDEEYAIGGGGGCNSYWYDQWDPILKSFETQAAEYIEATSIRRREDISVDNLRSINANLGDARLANIHKTLESFGKLRRAPHQTLFHKKFIISCLPHIYGSEWEWNQIRVMKQHKINKINHEVRRYMIWSDSLRFVITMICNPLPVSVITLTLYPRLRKWLNATKSTRSQLG